MSNKIHEHNSGLMTYVFLYMIMIELDLLQNS